MMIDIKNPYFRQMGKAGKEIFRLISYQIEFTGEASYLSIAAYYSENEKEDELEDFDVQRNLSIIFWKMICDQANINFYTEI